MTRHHLLPLLLTVLLAACAMAGENYPDLPLEQNGLHRLPPGVQPALIPADQAVRMAQEAIGVDQQPAGVGRRLESNTGRTAWVVMFVTSREARPCGPAPLPGQPEGVCVTQINGAIVDDQAGAVIYSFEMGGELWPQD